MTTETKTPAFERVHESWQAVILEAIKGWRRPLATPWLAPILDGTAAVVWDNESQSKGYDNQAVTHLLPALLAQANRYERMGLGCSASDCRWIADQLRAEEMTVVNAYHLEGC